MVRFFMSTVLLLFASSAFAGLNFPANDFSPGWEKSGEMLKFKANNLYGRINGGAELFLEFGFDNLQVQRYAKDDFEINLEIYQMENSVSALGIYLMKCGNETPLDGISARNTGNAFQITAVKGACFFQVNNFSGEADFLPTMKSALNFLLDQISDVPPPQLLDLLPEAHLVAGSEKIIRGPYGLQPIFTFGEGDVLQLNREIFAVFGDYQVPEGDKFSRLIIPYPNSRRSAAALKNLLTHLDPYLTVIRKTDSGFIFQDYRKKYGSVSRSQKTVEILIDLDEFPEK